MAEFPVEFYLSRTDREAAQAGADRACLAAEELTRRGTRVATSPDAVREVAQRAELSFERVLEAIPNTVAAREE